MWTLVIAFVMGGNPVELKFTQLAQVNTYQECKDLSKELKKRGLDAHLFCVEKQ